MARLIAGRQLIIERSDIDLLLAHLHGWVPRGQRDEFNDLNFLHHLRYQHVIAEEIFEAFARAYTLGSAFSRQFASWLQVFNEIIGSDQLEQHLQDAMEDDGFKGANGTINLIIWIADQTKEHTGLKQSSASSKLAMFLWPDLPIFINDSVIRHTASYISEDGQRRAIGRHNYQELWRRLALLYDPRHQGPFFGRLQVPEVPQVALLTDCWLSRRLLDLALYRAVIADGPAPPPNAPRIEFCPCALR